MAPLDDETLLERCNRPNFPTEGDVLRAMDATGLPYDIVTLRAAAEVTGVRVPILRRAILRGDIQAWRALGWRLFIPLSAVRRRWPAAVLQ